MKKLAVVLLSLFLPLASYAAVQVIVLNVSDAGSNNITYNYLCWLTPPNPLPNPSFASAWKALGSSTGPTGAQVAALQAGTTIERQFQVTLSSSTPFATVESVVISYCNNQQSYINGIPGAGFGYGYTWNGSTWVLQ